MVARAVTLCTGVVGGLHVGLRHLTLAFQVSGQTKGHVKYVAKHEVQGRVELLRLLNPKALFETDSKGNKAPRFPSTTHRSSGELPARGGPAAARTAARRPGRRGVAARAAGLLARAAGLGQGL